MAEFRYVSSEGFLTSQVVQTSVDEWRPDSVLAFRAQLFIWAHLLSEAIQQCAEHDQQAQLLFSERLEAAQQYWPAEVDRLRDMRHSFGSTVVNFVSATSFTMFPSGERKGPTPKVIFTLALAGITVRSVDAPPFPITVREPANQQDAMRTARALVARALELLAPFEGKLPTPAT